MEWNQWGLVSACSQAVDRDAVCFAEPARPKGTDSKKGSFSTPMGTKPKRGSPLPFPFRETHQENQNAGNSSDPGSSDPRFSVFKLSGSQTAADKDWALDSAI